MVVASGCMSAPKIVPRSAGSGFTRTCSVAAAAL